MTEIKPVYQVFFDECTGWVGADKTDFELYDTEDTRILYHAAAYEALKQELDAQVVHTERQSKFIVERAKEVEALQKENEEMKEKNKNLHKCIKTMEADQKYRDHMATAKF